MIRLPQPLAAPGLPERFLNHIAPLALFLVEFDAPGFSDSAFADAGIDCPEPIARSVRKRRAEFFYGRLCAKAALAAIGTPGQVSVGAQREPRWPAAVVGSISHSDTIAAAAVAPAGVCGGVGIDLAERIAADGVDELIGIVVSKREHGYLASLGAQQDIALCLTVVFSAKETFFKAVYSLVREYFDFDAVEVVELDFGASLVQFEFRQTLCAGIRAGGRCTIPFALLDRHVLTVFQFSGSSPACADRPAPA
jgi:enterobactin synthetase component D